MNQTMNFKAYFESLKDMPEPVMPGQLPKVRFDGRGLIEYAKKKDIPPHELSREEKEMFIREL